MSRGDRKVTRAFGNDGRERCGPPVCDARRRTCARLWARRRRRRAGPFISVAARCAGYASHCGCALSTADDDEGGICANTFLSEEPAGGRRTRPRPAALNENRFAMAVGSGGDACVTDSESVVFRARSLSYYCDAEEFLSSTGEATRSGMPCRSLFHATRNVERLLRKVDCIPSSSIIARNRLDADATRALIPFAEGSRDRRIRASSNLINRDVREGSARDRCLPARRQSAADAAPSALGNRTPSNAPCPSASSSPRRDAGKTFDTSSSSRLYSLLRCTPIAFPFLPPVNLSNSAM